MLSLFNSNHDIAVYDNYQSYSYLQVHSVVNKIISYIAINKVKRLAMRIEQGFENYCLEWAAYLSGIIFCCYDIDAPIERVKYCNDNFKPDIVVSNTNLEGIATCKFEDILTNQIVSEKPLDAPNEIAYVLFTSGSTGIPKGVMVKRIALENVVNWARVNYAVDNTTIYAQYSKNSFDLSILDIFLSLSSGAKLVPFIGANKLLPGKMIRECKITHWHSVPSAFIALQNRHELTAQTLSSIKTVVFCGETLYPQLVKNILMNKPNINLWNTYGPTEATIFCSAIQLTQSSDNISIGKPISQMQFYIEGDSNEGELIIIGENVAKGYINNTDSNVFLTMKINGKTLPAYKSGDIVKCKENLYYFLFRKDNQVKIAGNRFDLDEITIVLNEMGFFSVASIVIGNLIYTFIQKPLKRTIQVSNIETMLKKRLPKYGLPSKIILLDELPLNSNGKIDKTKLKQIAINKGD